MVWAIKHGSLFSVKDEEKKLDDVDIMCQPFTTFFFSICGLAK
jgi:hypothetical protein